MIYDKTSRIFSEITYKIKWPRMQFGRFSTLFYTVFFSNVELSRLFVVIVNQQHKSVKIQYIFTINGSSNKHDFYLNDEKYTTLERGLHFIQRKEK